MKKVLLSLLFVTLLISCESDDSNNNDNVDLEGNWKLTSWKSTNPHDINNDGTETTDLLTEFNCYNNEFIEFNADNTGMILNNTYVDLNFEIEIGTTDSFVWSSECINEVDNITMTWSQSNSEITITDGEGFANTVTLDGNKLKFTVPEGFTAYDETTQVEITEDLFIEYTKQ